MARPVATDRGGDKPRDHGMPNKRGANERDADRTAQNAGFDPARHQYRRLDRPYA